MGNPTASTPTETVGDFCTTKYLDWYKVQYPSSIERIERIVRNYILPRFRNDPLNMIKPYDVAKWMTDLMDGKAPFESCTKGVWTVEPMPEKVAPETANKILKTVKAMLNRAVEWELIEVNPIAGKKIKNPKSKSDKPPVFFTGDELKRLYDNCAERNKWMWKVIANTGMRRTEALNLRHTHIRGDQLIIMSTNLSPAKSGERREVPLNTAAKKALKELAKLVDHETFVFPRMFPSSLSRLCRHDLRRAKLPGSIHALRHTFGANLVMEGVPLRAVQILMGHASIETTEIYANLTKDYLSKTTTKINL